jgi:hypothetical protein
VGAPGHRGRLGHGGRLLLARVEEPDRRRHYTTGGAVSGSGGDAGSATLSTSAWHHLAITWDGQTVTGYLDGQPSTSNAGTALTIDPSMPLSIGMQGGLDGLVGDLDELAYYNRALSPAEVSALANP